jgi:hypothetical protein
MFPIEFVRFAVRHIPTFLTAPNDFSAILPDLRICMSSGNARCKNALLMLKEEGASQVSVVDEMSIMSMAEVNTDQTISKLSVSCNKSNQSVKLFKTKINLCYFTTIN